MRKQMRTVYLRGASETFETTKDGYARQFEFLTPGYDCLIQRLAFILIVLADIKRKQLGWLLIFHWLLIGVQPYSPRGLEARARIELANKGFADLCLTTWLPRLMCLLFRNIA